MTNTTEQYLDVGGKRTVLEVLAGPLLTDMGNPPSTIASLVMLSAKGNLDAALTRRPTTEYLFGETFAEDNPTIDALNTVNVHLNREQAVELACTLLNAAGVDYELYADVEDPSADVFRSY